MKRFLLCAGVFALTGATLLSAAPSLDMVPPLAGDTESSARAVVWDGTKAIAVGRSRAAATSEWDVGAGSGIFFNGTSSSYLVTSDGAGATQATGLGLRNTPGGVQLVAHGLTGSGHNLYSSMDGGVTWATKNRLTSTFANPYAIGTANTLGVSPTLDVDATNKVFFGMPWNQNNASSKQLAMITGSGGTVGPEYKATLSTVAGSISTTSNPSTLNGVSGTSASGLAYGVGSRSPNAYLVTSAGNKNTLATLNGTAGEAFAISKDGLKIFGRSTMPDTSVKVWMNTGFNHTVAGSGTAVELPGLAGATTGVPYGASDDGAFAVGMSYPGQERAVIWDTIAMTVTDLNDVFASQIAAAGFLRLSRAYSIDALGDGRLAIAGIGAWSGDGGVTFNQRGFVLVTPEPTTLAFLALAALPMLRRRR